MATISTPALAVRSGNGDTARPAWLDPRLYPFTSRFITVDRHRIHYIDEGVGPVLLFLHPGVGWSFAFRDVILHLRDHFRCVALDLPGFGLSANTPAYRHTLAADALLIERFIAALGLRDVTLFAQDVTGAVGHGVVIRHPEWFRAVIVGPGFSWPLDAYPGVARMVAAIGSPVARLLGITTNFFLEYYLRTITHAPHQRFSPVEKRAYRGPMASRAVRRHPHDLFASAAHSRSYLADLEARLRALDGRLPALLLFGETDGLVKMGWLARYERIFPRHRSVVISGAHHFPQEYDAARVAAEIRAWWDADIAA